MPGIAGIFGINSPGEGRRRLDMMLAAMSHSLPCAAGRHVSAKMGIYAGWIAQEGSFAAQESVRIAGNDVSLALSGECYCPVGSTSSDDCAAGGTDGRKAVLAAYLAHGAKFVSGLNGLFSGILIDARRERAFLFNDRYAAERLYYHERDGVVYVASEAKALLAVLPDLRSFSDEGVAEFLAFGSTRENRTLFRGVSLVPGGSLWSLVGPGTIKQDRYFSPAEWESQAPLSDEEFGVNFAETFERVLPRYLHTDSSLGISITGGLDTRMIMACLPRERSRLTCYTYGGLEGDTLDIRLGAQVAAACGIPHETLRIRPDFLRDFDRHLEKTVHATDGCAGVLETHEIYLSVLARQISALRLTGNYGSEILRSMSTLKPISMGNGLIEPGMASKIDEVVRDEELSGAHPVTQAAFREVPYHLYGMLAAGRSQLMFRTPYLDNELVGLAYRAPTTARTSAGSAIHLIETRSPAIAKIPTDRGLAVGRDPVTSLAHRLYCAVTFKLDYYHKQGMPGALTGLEMVFDALARTSVMGLHKFLQYRLWFRRDLAEYLRDALASQSLREMPFWSPDVLVRIADDHIEGRRNNLDEIHALLTLDAVDRILIRPGPTKTELGPELDS